MILNIWLLVRVCLLARFHVEMYPSRVFLFVVEEGCNVKGMQCPAPRAQADPASLTHKQERITRHIRVCSITSG